MSDDSNNRDDDGDGEGRPSSMFVMFILVLAVLGLILLFWYFIQGIGGRSLDYVQFKKLIEASKQENGKLAPGSTGSIDIPNKAGGVERISDISDILIDDRRITFKAKWKELPKQAEDGKPIGKEMEPVAIFWETAVIPDVAKEANQIILDNKIADVRFADPPSPFRENLFWAGVIVTLFMLGLLALRKILSIGSPMSFGRSRGRLYAQEDLGITFNDVAGIDEAVEEVREVVDFLRNAEKYQRLGGRIPKGVLLVGPPGTGKTLLAKAIAGEAGVPFFSLSGSDFVEMFVGVGAARVRDMFEQAEAKSPCIVFIDELDALGKSRGGSVVGGHDEREQTLNALLVEMDGFGSNNGIIVMAATNRPETLDPALLRPGRFDRHVLVDRPDIRGREAILKVHAKHVKLDASIDLKEVARLTPGCVGADLANLCNEAALLAARKDRSAVSIEDFNEAIERVTVGLEKKQRLMGEEEKLRTAYHEAGHAIVACSLPNTDPVHKVSIIPRGFAAGYVWSRPENDRFMVTQSELESRIQVALGGTLAEEIFFSDVASGCENDLEKATEMARAMVTVYGMSKLGRVQYKGKGGSMFLGGGDDDLVKNYSSETAREIDVEVRRIIDEALARTRQILETRKDAVVALAKRLIEIESLDGNDLKKLLDETIVGPRVVPGTAPAHSRSLGTPLTNVEPRAESREGAGGA